MKWDGGIVTVGYRVPHPGTPPTPAFFSGYPNNFSEYPFASLGVEALWTVKYLMYKNKTQ